MSLNLQNSIYSRQDLKAVILEVKRYVSWYAQTARKMQVTKDNTYQEPQFDPLATNIINDWAKENPVSEKSLDALLDALENFAETAPIITITLAAPAPNSLKKTLIDWCRQNIAPNALIDFRFNATMLGGMVVQYGSHVYDWSFRRQILAKREKFAEILRHV
jgi:F0F1-type ATP synthase delta subunit